MHPQPNLKLNPTPTSTTVRSQDPVKHAAVGIVFSLTLASGLHPDLDLYRKVTLAPVPYVGAGSTGAATVLREAVIVEAASNPLEALINEIHATISEATWAKMPRDFADSVDRVVYGG